MYKNLICLLIMLLMTSCSFFQVRRPIIEQGNIITNDKISKLYTGMSPSQVAEIMGTPVLTNILTPNRMEYIYTYKERTDPLIRKRITCLFSDGKLRSIQRS